MTVFKNKLFIAFETQTGNQLAIISSSDGVTFPALPTILSTKIGSPPAIATYENQLILAFHHVPWSVRYHRCHEATPVPTLFFLRAGGIKGIEEVAVI